MVNPVILGSADPDSQISPDRGCCAPCLCQLLASSHSQETIMTATAVSSAIGCLVVAFSSPQLSLVPVAFHPSKGLTEFAEGSTAQAMLR